MKNLPLLTEIYLQEKKIIKEQDMPEALQESSEIMKAGRAYKNISMQFLTNMVQVLRAYI